MLSEDTHVILIDVLSEEKIIPISVLRDVKNALKLAEILTANSVNLLEITLRTEEAYMCLKEVSREFPGLNLGAGSVLSIDSLSRAVDSGAAFGVAPVLDRPVLDYALKHEIPFIPGVATPTEFNDVLKANVNLIKLFPVSSGGTDYIKAITAPFKMFDFHLIPTGGIKENNIMDYIKLERVIACGASYIVDNKLIEDGEFSEIEKRIRRVKGLLESS